MILAATMLRSTTWSIVTAHIDDNELYEDLLVNITKDVFSSTKTSVLASQRALRVNGPSQRPEWIPSSRGQNGSETSCVQSVAFGVNHHWQNLAIQATSLLKTF